MTSPFAASSNAFDPFFTDAIAFFAHRPDGEHRGTVMASIFDEGYADAFAEDASTSSTIGVMQILVRRIDWAAKLSTPPQPGDRFVSPTTGKTYATHTITHFAADIWRINAREIAS